MISLFPRPLTVLKHLPLHGPPMIRRRPVYAIQQEAIDLSRQADCVLALVWLQANDPEGLP